MPYFDDRDRNTETILPVETIPFEDIINKIISEPNSAEQLSKFLSDVAREVNRDSDSPAQRNREAVVEGSNTETLNSLYDEFSIAIPYRRRNSLTPTQPGTWAFDIEGNDFSNVRSLRIYSSDASNSTIDSLISSITVRNHAIPIALGYAAISEYGDDFQISDSGIVTAGADNIYQGYLFDSPAGVGSGINDVTTEPVQDSSIADNEIYIYTSSTESLVTFYKYRGGEPEVLFTVALDNFVDSAPPSDNPTQAEQSKIYFESTTGLLWDVVSVAGTYAYRQLGSIVGSNPNAQRGTVHYATLNPEQNLNSSSEAPDSPGEYDVVINRADCSVWRRRSDVWVKTAQSVCRDNTYERILLTTVPGTLRRNLSERYYSIGVNFHSLTSGFSPLTTRDLSLYLLLPYLHSVETIPLLVEQTQPMDGTDGTPGRNGYSAGEITIYLLEAGNAPAPARPTGGMYNFVSGALVPPTGWTSNLLSPTGSQVLWVSLARPVSSAEQWTGGNDSWSTPIATSSNVQANFIYTKSTSVPPVPPSTTEPNPIPTGWYDSVTDIPTSSSGRTYTSFGTSSLQSVTLGGILWRWRSPTLLDGIPGNSPSVLTGLLPPEPSLGSDGDLYIDRDGTLYTRQGGAWVGSGFSIRGSDAATIHSGDLGESEFPSLTIGRNGDLFFATDGRWFMKSQTIEGETVTAQSWTLRGDLSGQAANPGASITTGALPDNSVGNDGDIHITTEGILYRRQSGVWVTTGLDLTTQAGSVVHTDIDAPLAENASPPDNLGVEGDVFITQDGRLYTRTLFGWQLLIDLISTQAVMADASMAHINWHSNDNGVTFTPTDTTQAHTIRWLRGGTEIASVTLTFTRTDSTIALTSTALTGENLNLVRTTTEPTNIIRAYRHPSSGVEAEFNALLTTENTRSVVHNAYAFRSAPHITIGTLHTNFDSTAEAALRALPNAGVQFSYNNPATIISTGDIGLSSQGGVDYPNSTIDLVIASQSGLGGVNRLSVSNTSVGVVEYGFGQGGLGLTGFPSWYNSWLAQRGSNDAEPARILSTDSGGGEGGIAVTIRYIGNLYLTAIVTDMPTGATTRVAYLISFPSSFVLA